MSVWEAHHGPFYVRMCSACGRLLFPSVEADGTVRYLHPNQVGHPAVIGPVMWPEGFVPTSRHRRWQGKFRCAYCTATGWLSNQHHPEWWGRRHGMNCAKKP